VDHRRGPNPTKNWETLIPKALAVEKWPASWIRMMARMATTYTRIWSHVGIRNPLAAGKEREDRRWAGWTSPR
jgi:hypothetical protein